MFIIILDHPSFIWYKKTVRWWNMFSGQSSRIKKLGSLDPLMIDCWIYILEHTWNIPFASGTVPHLRSIILIHTFMHFIHSTKIILQVIINAFHGVAPNRAVTGGGAFFLFICRILRTSCSVRISVLWENRTVQRGTSTVFFFFFSYGACGEVRFEIVHYCAVRCGKNG